MRRIQRKPKTEPAVPLINIVFLMLIFFLVAGTISQPLDQELALVETSDLDGREPPDALVLHEDGSLSFRGDVVEDLDAYLTAQPEDQLATVKIVPDRAVEAGRLVEVARAIRSAGAESVVIVTERALP